MTNGYPLIQFVELPDLLAEMQAQEVIRVEKAIHKGQPNASGLWFADYEVHARAIYRGAILAWFYRVARIRMLYDQPFGPEYKEDGDPLAVAEAELARIAAEVRAWGADWGAQVRPGWITVPEGLKLQAGNWPPRDGGADE